MFFIMGITEGKKELHYDGGMHLCPTCGAYASYTVFMTYMCLSLFFIPVFRWNKKYYVKPSCCNSLLALGSEKGKAISRGEKVRIEDADLAIVRQNSRAKRCGNCGYETTENFAYCPKCGERL